MEAWGMQYSLALFVLCAGQELHRGSNGNGLNQPTPSHCLGAPGHCFGAPGHCLGAPGHCFTGPGQSPWFIALKPLSLSPGAFGQCLGAPGHCFSALGQCFSTPGQCLKVSLATALASPDPGHCLSAPWPSLQNPFKYLHVSSPILSLDSSAHLLGKFPCSPKIQVPAPLVPQSMHSKHSQLIQSYHHYAVHSTVQKPIQTYFWNSQAIK